MAAERTPIVTYGSGALVLLEALVHALPQRRTLLLPHNDSPATRERIDELFPGTETFEPTDGLPADPREAFARAGVLLQRLRTLSVADEHVVAVFFTSGSTGPPAPHARRWVDLRQGARLWDALLGAVDARTLLTATVFPQHMFGFESLVQRALFSAAAVWPVRIFHPADLECALQSSFEKVWLHTTPLHLTQLLESVRLPRSGVLRSPLQRVVSATMPLDRAIAVATQERWQIVLDEIYGCTEVGAIATRRPALTEIWTLADGFELLDQGNEGTTLRTPFHTDTLLLADRLEAIGPDPAGHAQMRLHGRAGDMVKVAGKRESLARLQLALAAVPGVHESLYLDMARWGSERPAALVVAPEVPVEQIRAALRLEFDAVFVPRPLVKVRALPRDNNGKILVEQALALLKAARPRQ